MQRFLTQPMYVAAQFTGHDGRYVKIAGYGAWLPGDPGR